MSERVAHADIPQEARDSIEDIYTPEGCEIWWNSRNKLLDDERPRDIWPTNEGRRRILALLDALAGGAIL